VSNVTDNVILAQPNDHIIDQLNAYASQKLNSVEPNYLTMEREGFVTIFFLQNLCHYMLENPFNFYTYCQDLEYLVNKCCINEQYVNGYYYSKNLNLT
jgi:hypothetical protein